MYAFSSLFEELTLLSTIDMHSNLENECLNGKCKQAFCNVVKEIVESENIFRGNDVKLLSLTRSQSYKRNSLIKKTELVLTSLTTRNVINIMFVT